VLTSAHNASVETEKERIISSGGKVIWAKTWRVEGVLAVTRSIGDCAYPCVICDPAITSREITQTDEFIVLGSDGLFQALIYEEICAFVRSALREQKNLNDICKSLVEAALATGVQDNVSAVIIVFTH
jgi:protein phosphatase 2C